MDWLLRWRTTQKREGSFSASFRGSAGLWAWLVANDFVEAVDFNRYRLTAKALKAYDDAVGERQRHEQAQERKRCASP